jgi:hypothetical protein
MAIAFLGSFLEKSAQPAPKGPSPGRVAAPPIKSTLVKQVCKYCTFKCVTDDFAHDMVFN